MATLSQMQRVSPSEEFDRYIHLFTTHALNYSPRTVDDFYRYEFKALRKYLDEHHSDIRPDGVTPEILRNYLAHRQQTRSNARALRQYQVNFGVVENQQAIFLSCYGAPLYRRHIITIIKKHGNNAGIPPNQCGVHMFRRFFAVQFLRNGGDFFSLQKLLGHSTLEMTRKYAEMAQSDVIAQHRAHSPADSLNMPQQTNGRKRMR